MNLSSLQPSPRTSIAPRRLRAALGLSALLLSACQGASLPPAPPPSPTSPPNSRPPSSRLELPYQGAKGCTGRRWVGLVKPGGPNLPSSWRAASPFQGAPAAAGARAAAPMPARLAKYQLYKWEGPKAPTSNDIKNLKAKVGPSALEEDCVIAGPLGVTDGLLDAAHASQLTSFRAWTGLSASPLLPGSAKIHIAVPDTSPDSLLSGTIPHGASEHGYTMAWIAREQACIGSTCDQVEVSTELAMPQISNNNESASGGYFGTPVQLADAIRRSVDRWIPRVASEPHLIINLSLGWQPGVAGGDPSGLPAQAVLDAIRYAHCHGALLVAAAGNHPGGPAVPSGQTYPAAWESESVPTEDECKLFVAGHLGLGLPPADPAGKLVFAVGGTNHARGPLLATRPGSLSRFAAPAVLGIAGDPGQPLPPALTGTSVATAVVSGVAAAVWSHKPQLTASGVMDLLHETGLPVDVTDPSLLLESNSSNRLMEVNRCRAVAAVSPAPKPTCNAPLPIATGVDPLIQAIFDGFPDLGPPPDYQHPPLTLTPSSQWPGLSTPPSVYPQPGQAGCGSACQLIPSTDTLHVYINPNAMAGQTLKDMTLIVKLVDGNVMTWQLGPQVLMNPGFYAKFGHLGMSAAQGPIAEAALSWTVMEGLTQIGSLQETIEVRY